MLRNLIIENYAIISKLEIEFREGLTIITGETGAGKSILLGALALILGKRADINVLHDKEKKCIVEGTFETGNYNLEGFFGDNQLEFENETILRREIAPSGKSRAFINDTPVNLDVISELGTKLIDIHSQHQTLQLSNSQFQMQVVDSYAGNLELLNSYILKLKNYHSLNEKLKTLQEEAIKSHSELDYLAYQHAQLESAKLAEDEQEQLEQELEQLTHAEEIKTTLANCLNIMHEHEQSILPQLKLSLTEISRINKFLNHENMVSRIESAYIELKDISFEMESLNSKISDDPVRLEQVRERLDLIYSLLTKHTVTTIPDLIRLKEEIASRIQTINSYDLETEAIESEISALREELEKLTDKLSSSRKNVVISLEKNINNMLRDLAMPNGSFKVGLTQTDSFNQWGKDKIQFLFTANKNSLLQDISKVASGGELSRLMLCIKSLMSGATGLPTIVFDEIDTGVSGEVAEKVGNIINRMADGMQIINITHLPQIASKGNYHLLVYKEDVKDKTVTRIRPLLPVERHLEIARMLSGEEVTSAALENAKQLLKIN